MRIRNNTNRDFQLFFSNGQVINFSRAEISRELTLEEANDPLLKKAIKNRWIVQYNEPLKNIEIVAEKPRIGEDKKKSEVTEVNRRKAKKEFGHKED